MSEVKRWTLWTVSESGCELEPYSEESPDGTYIKASDYDQLKAENERLKLRLWDLEHSEVDHVLRERDTLRKSLDEARELLTVASEIIHEQAMHIDRPMTDLGSEALTRIDAWLEANK